MADPGKLRDRITLRQRDVAKDALGQPVETWVDVTTVWGDILFQSGVEALRNGTPTSQRNASIRIRAGTTVTNAMQAVNEGMVFNIRAVLPDRRERKYQFLICEVTS